MILIGARNSRILHFLSSISCWGGADTLSFPSISLLYFGFTCQQRKQCGNERSLSAQSSMLFAFWCVWQNKTCKSSNLWNFKSKEINDRKHICPCPLLLSSVDVRSLAAAVAVFAGCWWAEAQGDVTAVLPADWQLLVPGPHPTENRAGWVGAVTFRESLPRSCGEGGLW